MGFTTRPGLALPANVRDDPVFKAKIEFQAVPLEQVKTCVARARVLLAEILASGDHMDWPLTFWFSSPAVETPSPPGTRNVVVQLHVVGDGAGRRLAAVANRLQTMKAKAT